MCFLFVLCIATAILGIIIILILSIKIRIRLLIIDFKIIVSLSVSLFYFINISDLFVYNNLNGAGTTYFKGLKIKRKTKKKNSKARGLINKLFRIKKLYIMFEIGVSDAAATAELCGIINIVGINVCNFLNFDSFIKCVPAYNKNVFKVKADCIIGI